ALLSSTSDHEYQLLFVTNPSEYRSDVLESLVEIVFEALLHMARKFDGADDAFWMTAIGVFSDVFPTIGQPPDGMTPFQQRLALKIVDKLEDNMRGYYPALSRVVLSCVGPYRHEVGPTNRTAFNILKDAAYLKFQRFPELAARKPEKLSDYLPKTVE